MTTDEARLAQIQARFDAATPGPWAVECVETGVIRPDRRRLWVNPVVDVEMNRHQDAHFIAHSRDDIAFLLAQTAALRDQLAAAETLRDGANERVRIVMDAKNHWQERAIAAETELARAEAVVKALANADPTAAYQDGTVFCTLCISNEYRHGWPEHPDDCPWQMAQGLAARTPTPGAAGEVG